MNKFKQNDNIRQVQWFVLHSFNELKDKMTVQVREWCRCCLYWADLFWWPEIVCYTL